MDTISPSTLGSIAITCGFLGAAIQLLDWLLPENSVSWIRDRLTQVWVWLDDQSIARLLTPMQSARLMKWLVIGLFLATSGYAVITSILDDADKPVMPMPELIVVLYAVVPGMVASLAVFAIASFFIMP